MYRNTKYCNQKLIDKLFLLIRWGIFFSPENSYTEGTETVLKISLGYQQNTLKIIWVKFSNGKHIFKTNMNQTLQFPKPYKLILQVTQCWALRVSVTLAAKHL